MSGVETKQTEDKNILEDVDAIFSGEELSEDFKNKAKAIFEAAILSKLEEEKAALEEQFNAQLEEQTKEFADNLVNKVDEYLEYVVSEWMEENKLAVDNSIKSAIAEDFMVGLKNLFTEHYMDIPDEQVSVVEEFATKVTSLEEKLDKALSRNYGLTTELNSYKKEKIAIEVSEGLSEVQWEKLKSLAENIDYVSDTDYKEKLLLTKKKYFESKDLDESVSNVNKGLDSEETSLDESYSPIMSHYMQSISRTLKK